MEEKHYCPHCWHEFVQGEWNYNYETGKLDFECPECNWRGTEDDVENDEDEGELRIWEGSYNKRTLKRWGYIIVTWPDSQYLTETIGHRNHSWLINDNYGLNRFGSCAYVVEGDWYNENV